VHLPQGVGRWGVRVVVAVLLAGLGWPGAVGAAPLDVGARSDAIRATYPSQSTVQERTFFSPTLGRDMPYTVYVPPGYFSDGLRYPVLYMLHGMSGSNSEWQGYGLFGAADELMRTYQIPPMLIVLPQGDQSYWFDHADGTRWGTYTAVDLVREVDENWRTIPDRDHRAVGGLSMGAVGALQLGLNYPRVFGIVGAHSPALRDWAESADWFPSDFYGGDQAYFARFDPAELAAAHPDAARTLRIWLDVGEEDEEWRPITTAFHTFLDGLGVPNELHVLPGDHNGDRYWGPHSAEYVRFYAGEFARAASSPATSKVRSAV
jgi:enterochelin esterase-like enzyme